MLYPLDRPGPVSRKVHIARLSHLDRTASAKLARIHQMMDAMLPGNGLSFRPETCDGAFIVPQEPTLAPNDAGAPEILGRHPAQPAYTVTDITAVGDIASAVAAVSDKGRRHRRLEHRGSIRMDAQFGERHIRQIDATERLWLACRHPDRRQPRWRHRRDIRRQRQPAAWLSDPPRHGQGYWHPRWAKRARQRH